MDYRQKLEQCFIALKHKRKNFARRLGYQEVLSDSKVTILRRKPWKGKILSAFGSSIVIQSAFSLNILYYYPDILSNYRKKIHFNRRNFPGLIHNSKIDSCMLLPYLRNLGGGRYAKSVRLVIVTDKCQVFHNNPARCLDCDGIAIYNDDIRFEESAIWDLPGRKYPSMHSDCATVEKFFPYLPEQAYEYHPILNTDPNYKDLYGNGGFPKAYIVTKQGMQQELSRFYFPKRESMCNSFHHIGGEEPDYKLTLIGTYRANNNEKGARTVIFATDDGGRNWFAKYEFGDFGQYDFSQGASDWEKGWGNVIKIPKDLTRTHSVNLFVTKRTITPPTQENKEPQSPFDWNTPIAVEAVEGGNITAVLRTKEKHGLSTGNIIAIQSEDETTNYKALCNNVVSSTHGGNGTLFKVNVLDDYSFEIYEYVHSADNPICCRHIHQINRVKDGWLIGTGEIYPNGWLLYFQMKEADTYSIKRAWDEFNIYRLNSAKSSVQRTLGAIILDDKVQTIIFASDHDTLERAPIEVPENRTLEITRNSIGIYKGKLSDIDNRDQYDIIYEAKEPSFLFKKVGCRLIFGGMRGEFAFSDDEGLHWNTYHIDTDMFNYHGAVNGSIVIGDYIIQFN